MNYRLTPLQQVVELLRPWLLLTFYLAFAYCNLWWLAVPTAIITAFASFIQLHDCMHSSLGLSKKVNSLFITMSALLILKSGHSVQVTHLRHHAQCLGENDPEGEPANWTLKQVFLNGPYHIFTLRFASLKISPNTKRIQLAETAITVFVLIAFLAIYFATGSIIGMIYWSVVFVVSSLMPLWASYIPHKMAPRNPARLFGVRLAQIWTPIISSFAFHHLHHAYPKIPTALLPKAAHELPEPEEE